MIEAVVALPAVILALAAWILQQLLHGGAPAMFPPEIGRAFVQVEKTALKWEQVGEMLANGWVVFMLAAFVLAALLGGRK